MAENEALEHAAFGEDLSDSIEDSVALGILVGESRSEGIDSFFCRFEEWLNRDIDDDESQHLKEYFS